MPKNESIPINLGLLKKLFNSVNKNYCSSLHALVGLSRYAIQKYGSGKNANLDTVLKIANYFGLLQSIFKSVHQLINEQNDISMY